jgi:hypothetical protein
MPSDEEGVSPRRTWTTITLAAAVAAASIITVVTGWLLSQESTSSTGGGLIALGLVVAPFVFMTLAFGSKHRSAAAATVVAMLVSVVVAVPVLALVRDVVTGMVAGYAAGTTSALRYEPEIHSRAARWVAVAAITIYVFALLRTVTVAGLVAGPLLPVIAVGVADLFTRRRRELADR